MANDIAFHCPQCEAHLMAKGEIAGKKVACPKCGQAIEVPTTGEELQS